MTHTITETITRERQLKPSEVYTDACSKQHIEKLLEKWEIVGFRLPLSGEHYILAKGGGSVDVFPKFHAPGKEDHGIRFVVKPRSCPLTFPEWE